MRITSVISSAILKGLRVFTHSPHSDVIKTNEQLSPFGLDANPHPGIKGAIQPATTTGRGAILGFFNKFVAALYGERRMYSTLPDGSEIVTEIFQFNNGSMMIRAGIDGGEEKYSLFIDSDGTVAETTPQKIITGNLIIDGSLTINGIDFGTHKHPYTDDGNPAVTEPPI